MNLSSLICIFSCFFGTIFSTSIPIFLSSTQYLEIRNKVLRAYIFTTKKQVKGSLINKIYKITDKSTSFVNLLVLDVNYKYYKLSEDERLLLEEMINILF
jgi:hypothetical protein